MNAASPELSEPEPMQEKRSRNSLPRDGQEPDCGVEKERWVDRSLDASHRSLERGSARRTAGGGDKGGKEPVLCSSVPVVRHR